MHPRARPLDPPRGVADRLHSAAIRLLRLVRRQDAELGIGPAALSVLSVLVFGGGDRTAAELAAIEQVRPATMSRLLATLQADGLIDRATDPHDRRSMRVRATSDGRILLRHGRRRRVAELADRLARLSPAELERLDHAIALIERLLT